VRPQQHGGGDVAGQQVDARERRQVGDGIRVHALDPDRAEVDRRTVGVRGPAAPAHAVARLEHRHRHAVGGQRARRAQAGGAGAEHQHALRRQRRRPLDQALALQQRVAQRPTEPAQELAAFHGYPGSAAAAYSSSARRRSTSWSTIGAGRSGAQRST
jgi:hypothetical protein